jgi:hypothetical protein
MTIDVTGLREADIRRLMRLARRIKLLEEECRRFAERASRRPKRPALAVCLRVAASPGKRARH